MGDSIKCILKFMFQCRPWTPVVKTAGKWHRTNVNGVMGPMGFMGEMTTTQKSTTVETTPSTTTTTQ